MAPKLQEVADELERRETLRFSSVPHDETKFRVWKFGAMRDIKAKLMTIKYRDGMETAVDAYIAHVEIRRKATPKPFEETLSSFCEMNAWANNPKSCNLVPLFKATGIADTNIRK